VKRSRALWTVLALLGLAFWGYVVPYMREWASVHAWGGFLLFCYVLYWQYGTER